MTVYATPTLASAILPPETSASLTSYGHPADYSRMRCGHPAPSALHLALLNQAEEAVEGGCEDRLRGGPDRILLQLEDAVPSSFSGRRP